MTVHLSQAHYGCEPSTSGFCRQSGEPHLGTNVRVNLQHLGNVKAVARLNQHYKYSMCSAKVKTKHGHVTSLTFAVFSLGS